MHLPIADAYNAPPEVKVSVNAMLWIVIPLTIIGILLSLAYGLAGKGATAD